MERVAEGSEYFEEEGDEEYVHADYLDIKE